MIPSTKKEIQVLEIGASLGRSTSQFKDELRALGLKFFLDVYENNESNRFYLSMIVPPTQLFIKILPQKKYNVILLPEGITNASVLSKLVTDDSSVIIIRYPKVFKSRLEQYFVCSLADETHWYFGIYRCYFKLNVNK